MKFVIMISGVVISSFYSFGQDTTFVFKPAAAESTDTTSSEGITYIEDERTAVLLRELKTYEIQGDAVIMDGYRIQIYFSNDRKLADEQRMKFIRLYPQHESFIEYDAPNYTVKVGSFRNIDEAEEFRASITREFPMSIIQKMKIKIALEKRQ